MHPEKSDGLTILWLRELQISPRIFKQKIATALMVYSGAWGKLINEKNLKAKISWYCPFKEKAEQKVDEKEDVEAKRRD